MSKLLLPPLLCMTVIWIYNQKSVKKVEKTETRQKTVFTQHLFQSQNLQEGHAPILQEVFNHKTFAQLRYKSLDKLRETGDSLDLSLSNNKTKVFHDPHTKEVTVAY